MNVYSDLLHGSQPDLPRSIARPIRAEKTWQVDLETFGARLASEIWPGGEPVSELDVRSHTNLISRDIARVVASLHKSFRDGDQLTPASNWLLDNVYVVEQAIIEVRRDLPKRFYQQLPKCKFSDVPRVLLLAWRYVEQTDSSVSIAEVTKLIRGYQSVQPLQIGELWAFPSVLRLVLLENLRRLALLVDQTRELRAHANMAADELANADYEKRVAVLNESEAHAHDCSFATQLLHRLRDGSRSATHALEWLEDKLEIAGTDAEEITLTEHTRQSTGNVTTGNIIRGLRKVDDTQWTTWFELVSQVDHVLREHSDFSALDFASRDSYRDAIEVLAKRSGKSEIEVATLAVKRASLLQKKTGQSARLPEAGCLLVGGLRPDFEKEIGYKVPLRYRLFRIFKAAGWPSLAIPVLAFAVFLLAITAQAIDHQSVPTGTLVFLMLLFAFPAIEAAMALFNTLITGLVAPTRLIGYEYKSGVPASARTMVVIPTMIGTRDDVDDAVHTIEVHFLSNMSGELHFAILSDWTDSKFEQTDIDLELLDALRSEVKRLNEKYPLEPHARFFALQRHRLFSESEGVWMGWERKRGKLVELNALLRGDKDTTYFAPDTDLPQDVQYVMTLDADTRITRDAVTRLVGKLQHPLNHPKVDQDTGSVNSGFGILQPRVTPSLTTGDEASFFQRIFSSNRGIDPYVFSVSDTYQDLFSAGSFTGKGLYHVDTFESTLKGRIDENSVLSHDLLEGEFARAALVTDVELIEDYPIRYLDDASRHHRWARGDWQLLNWAFAPNAGFGGLSRLKIIDNFRRSLTPVFWVAASIAGWTLLPLSEAAFWQIALILTLFVGLTLNVFDAFMPKSVEVTLSIHLAQFARDFAVATAHVAIQLVFLGHKAWMMGDAIVRTLYRVFVSRSNLLEWKTASDVARSSDRSLSGHYRAMAGALGIAVIGILFPLAAGSSGFVIAAVFSLMWIGSPAFAYLISQSAETEDQLHVSPEVVAELRLIARKTWYYFETFVTPEHNMLPPDNVQETPEFVIAKRTSPTNISVYLLSTISARDFGWISFTATISRLEQVFDTLDKMKRRKGHFFNWYDIETLKPLQPRYISSVDSGNLAGHLIAVASACRIWAEAPAAHIRGNLNGIVDVIGLVHSHLDSLPKQKRSMRPILRRLAERLTGMKRAVEMVMFEPETVSIRMISLSVMSGEIRNLAYDIHEEINSEDSRDLANWADKLVSTCEAHLSDAHMEGSGVAQLRRRLLVLGERARKFAFEMDFGFLVNPERKLLSIGYRVSEHQIDESCYDLLASEARLASLFAIAKGDVATDHWFRLGRPVTQIGMSGSLVSWSGSMFEYLMPPLVMKEPLGGILNQSNNLVVKSQINYARSKGLPWGISEAAYNARDRNMTYQYSNFGVPGLGLKRQLAQELVVAPYASLLAAQYRPAAALENLQVLRGMGAMGRYGFHDAVDFTSSRVPAGEEYVVVRNFMAHHHGMSIVAVANVAFEGRMRDRFHADPCIEAAELLLQEKAPRIIATTPIRKEASEGMKPDPGDEANDARLIENPNDLPHTVNIMSNGHYNLMLTATGTGYSNADQIAVTRWFGDPTEDRSGTFIFLREMQTNNWWSATAQPRPAKGEKSEARFSEDKATFIKSVGDLRTELECVVLGDGNGEARRLTIINEGSEDRYLEITSYGEIALNHEPADSAHPAFSKMFVRTEISDDGVIYATRRKRSEGDPNIALAHFMTESTGNMRDIEAETDRMAFIGRGRSISNAAAFDPGSTLSGNCGDVLDPVMALRCKVRAPAHKKVSVTFWTVVAANREDVENEIHRYQGGEGFNRQAILSWTRSQIQIRHVRLTPEEVAGVHQLAGYLLFPDPGLRAKPEQIRSGLGLQSLLWPMSISGDYPVFVLRISNAADIEIVASALRMQEYLRSHGLLADLVILNEQASSYVQELQHAIDLLCENSRHRGREIGPRQHIFNVRRDLIGEGAYNCLIASARVVLHTRNGLIADQIQRTRQSGGARILRSVFASPNWRENGIFEVADQASSASGENLRFWNGYGGLSSDDDAYNIRLNGAKVTPQPWINVISNEIFGFHTSAGGASFTWSRNSRDFQLTPWSNDAVENRPSEAFYIHDLDEGSVFSPLSCVVRDSSVTYSTKYEPGRCEFSAERHELAARLVQIVDPVEAVKIQQLSITNHSARTKHLRVFGYVEWLLGNNRRRTIPYIIPELDEASGVLTARNPFHVDFGNRVAFFASDGERQSCTSDRKEFLGKGGNSRWPAAVLYGDLLSRTVEPGHDPCAAIASMVDVRPGETVHLKYVLGDASGQRQAVDMAIAHLDRDFAERENSIREQWQGFAGALQVSTPDASFDAMVNTWLPYQGLACRIRARSAFYQASGAFGFRDQLQDSLAFLMLDADLARKQIHNAAQRQFVEGDVQHWWLPSTGAGVRTMISDDVVWLCYAVQQYVAVTGDENILDEEIPFLQGRKLKEGEHDFFFTPDTTKKQPSLYEHCARALELAISRSSERGIPLILGGDWNDGMNEVGKEGRGESIWLGWFLLSVLKDFAEIAKQRKDTGRSEAWLAHAAQLKKILNTEGWDTDWYLRGTFDDGSPLGSATSTECRIDSIAQSWSVISGGGDPKKSARAMDSVMSLLVDDDMGIVKLFTPPFDLTPKEPGYIKKYPPGVRENGGQYTHAAIWVVFALARLGRNGDAYRVFSMLNPLNHSKDIASAQRYRVEPYVVAADIYSHPDMEGRGGWTWYTGSAGWLYRAAVESILGITRHGQELRLNPALPPTWDKCSVRLKIEAARFSIIIKRGETASILQDGKVVSGNVVIEDGDHEIVVNIIK